MKIAKLVLAGALGAFMLTAAQAAPMVAPASMGAKSTVGLVQTVADKKKAAPKKAAKKKAAPKKAAKKKVGPGRCGTMNYYSTKTKKCVSKG